MSAATDANLLAALNHPRRRLPLSGAENVRDLGGYATRSGATTAWQVFVRAGDLHSLTSDDQQHLADYGITTVIDLRMQHEVEAQPNVFSQPNAAAPIRFMRHDFWGDRFDAYRSADKGATPAKKLADLYCAGLEASGFVMADIMSTFAASSDDSFVFHCRSGKDRTGLVAAMLLAIAGVAEDLICADFAYTSACLSEDAVNPIAANAPGAWQRTCEPETMRRTLSFVADQWGDVPGYLRAQGVSDADLAQIRAKLLR